MTFAIETFSLFLFLDDFTSDFGNLTRVGVIGGVITVVGYGFIGYGFVGYTRVGYTRVGYGFVG